MIFLNSNRCFWLKYTLSIILHSPVKKVVLRQEIHIHISRIFYKQKQSKPVLNEYVGGFWCERTTEDGLFSLEEAELWNMDSYFIQKQRFVVKNIFMMDLFLRNTQLLYSQDVNWWTGVDYLWIICDAFISLLLTAPIHCWAPIGKRGNNP